MEKIQITEKMPEFVRDTIGRAQRRLTLFEGEARKWVGGTWTRVRDNDQLKAVEQTLSGWRSRTSDLDVDKLRQRAENLSDEYAYKALHTVGIATQRDLKSVERKIDRLRSDVRKLGRGNSKPRGKGKGQAKGQTKGQAKGQTKGQTKAKSGSKK